MAKRERRHLTAEQEADAVRRVREERPVSGVARDLDRTESALRNRAALDEALCESKRSEAPLAPAEREELERLRAKVREREPQRDFLKKAAAFLARETGRDTS